MFVKLDENKKIIASSEIAREGYIKTEKEVVRSFDGGLYFKGEEPQKSLEELKKEKIVQLKNNCQNYIYSVYPIYKQLDIINPLNDYSIEKKEEMNIFIEENRNICKKKKELIKEAKTFEEIENINIKFFQEDIKEEVTEDVEEVVELIEEEIGENNIELPEEK